MRIVLLGQTNIKSETATERNTIVNYRAFPKLESIFKKSIFVNIFLSRENFTNLKYSWKSDYQTYNDAYQPLFQNESKEEINSNHCLLKIDLYQILQISVCKTLDHRCNINKALLTHLYFIIKSLCTVHRVAVLLVWSCFRRW